MKAFLFLLILLLNVFFCKAQLGATCRDTLQVQANSSCDGYYNPVCGCNSKTYRNGCFAKHDGLLVSNDGICEEFGFDFYPNVITNTDAEFFRPTIISKNNKICTLYILDVFGIYYVAQPITTFSSFVSGLPAFTDVIDLSGLHNGLYIISIVGGGTNVTKKFVRVQ